MRGFSDIRPFIPRLRFLFKVEITSRTLIPFFMPGSVHKSERSLTSCMRARFRIGSYTMPGQRQSAHSDFVGSRMYACLGLTCYLHFGQYGRGVLRATLALGVHCCLAFGVHCALALSVHCVDLYVYCVFVVVAVVSFIVFIIIIRFLVFFLSS